ncbi:MAG: hypothetical protein ACM3RX_00905 [Methanococcaceae archaeon]
MDNIIVARAKGNTVTTRKKGLRYSQSAFLTLACIFILFSIPANAAGTEIITNGGFESGYNGWYGYIPAPDNPVYAPTAILNTNNAYHGSTCVYLVGGHIARLFNLTTSSNITFSFYVNGTDYGTTDGCIVNLDTGHKDIDLDPDSRDWHTDGTWYKRTATVKLEPGHYCVHFYAHQYNPLYIDDVSVINEDIEQVISKEIWYTNNAGVEINWNYTQWLVNNANYGIPIKAFIWENKSTANFYHSDDMLTFGSSVTVGAVNAQYPADETTSSLYVIFLENNSYTSKFVGSATWGGGGSAAANESGYILPTPPEAPPINLPDWLNGTAPPNNWSLPDLLRPAGNFSAVNTYLDFIDSVFDPIREFTFAVANFLMSPITYITDYINRTTAQFNEIANSIVNAGFLAEVVRPFMMAIPTKVSMLIAFSLLLSIIAYLLRYR